MCLSLSVIWEDMWDSFIYLGGYQHHVLANLCDLGGYLPTPQISLLLLLFIPSLLLVILILLSY